MITGYRDSEIRIYIFYRSPGRCPYHAAAYHAMPPRYIYVSFMHLIDEPRPITARYYLRFSEHFREALPITMPICLLYLHLFKRDAPLFRLKR